MKTINGALQTHRNHQLRDPFEHMDRMLKDFWGMPMSSEWKAHEMTFQPTCDVRETENHILVSFDLPGVNKNDIHLEVDRDQLKLEGERKVEHEVDDASGYLRERQYGKFYRSFQLSEDINTDQIEASYESGVLRLLLPKSEKAKSKIIKVQEGKGSKLSQLFSPKKKVENEMDKKNVDA